MPNLKINNKTYTGVTEVHIPLADGSGNEDFAYINSDTKRITTNGEHDVKHYGTVSVAVPTDSNVELQTKSVTPSETAQTITPDSGYDGLSSVSVGAISKTYVGSGVTTKSAQTYTPGASNQTIASGQYLTGTQTILGDADLVAGNIRKGVNIFNVTGTYEGTGSGGGIDTSDATATADDIEEGKTAYVNGAKVTGTLKDIQMVAATRIEDMNQVNVNSYWVLGTSPTKCIVQQDGGVGLSVDPSMFGTCTAADVRQGVTFTSENGLRAAGTLVVSSSGGGGLPSGISALASGTYTPASDQSGVVTVEHNLGVTPNFCIWMVEENISSSSSIRVPSMIMGAGHLKSVLFGTSYSNVFDCHYSIRGYGSGGYLSNANGQDTNSGHFTPQKAPIYSNGSYPLKAGYTYRWVCGVMDTIQ